jgi:hypothetical protein
MRRWPVLACVRLLSPPPRWALRASAPRRDEDKGEADDDDLIGEAEVELPGGGEVGGKQLLGKEEWQVRGGRALTAAYLSSP